MDREEKWSKLVLRLLRKIGVVNSDTDPTVAEIIMAAEDAIENFNPEARIEALIEDFRNLSGVMEFIGMHCEDGWEELLAIHKGGGR